MNGGVMTMEVCLGMGGETVTLIGLPSQKSARKQLSGTVDDVVKAVAALVEKLVSSAAEKRTGDEFRTAFQESFPVYVRAIVSLSVILYAATNRQSMESLVNESFSELEADFREHAVVAFGSEIRDQAIFTVWTLRKTNDLVNVILSAGKLAEMHKTQDAEFASQYLNAALRARFSIDCLTHSMRTKKSVYPEVLTVVSDGLRAAVDAYAWVRRAADLHAPQMEADMPFLEPDEEDLELLRESMYDMVHEPA